MVVDIATDRLCVWFKGEMIVQSNAESFHCIRGRNGRACNGGLTDSGKSMQSLARSEEDRFRFAAECEAVMTEPVVKCGKTSREQG